MYLRVYDSRDSSRKTAPSPSLCYSLTHAHRSIGYPNIPQSLTDSVTRLIYLRVYDNRDNSSKSTPSQSSLCYSLTHTHRSIGYRNISPSSLCYSVSHTHRSIGYHNIPHPLAESAARLIHLRVYDNRSSSSKSAPSPSSL